MTTASHTGFGSAQDRKRAGRDTSPRPEEPQISPAPAQLESDDAGNLQNILQTIARTYEKSSAVIERMRAEVDRLERYRSDTAGPAREPAATDRPNAAPARDRAPLQSGPDGEEALECVVHIVKRSVIDELVDIVRAELMEKLTDQLAEKLADAAKAKVIDEIQPLLVKLKGLAEAGGAAPPPTDMQLIAQLRDAMPLRVGRRRGFLPTLYKEENK